jgi:hypothetical protein
VRRLVGVSAADVVKGMERLGGGGGVRWENAEQSQAPVAFPVVRLQWRYPQRECDFDLSISSVLNMTPSLILSDFM